MTTVMIYCIALIIVVALICATRLYPLWLRHDCRRYRKLMAILQEQRKENIELRKELRLTYDEWLNDFGDRQKQVSEIFDKLFEITEKLQKQ